MRRWSPIFSFLAALTALSCAKLEDLPAGKCGNGVVELGEDCEHFSGEEFACRAAGEELQCTFECTAASACPPGFGCGADDVCRRPGGSFDKTALVQVGSQALQLFSGDFDADRRQDLVAIEPGRARIYFTDAASNVEQLSLTSELPPAIGKLGSDRTNSKETLDTTDDLVMPSRLGIGTLLAQGDRSFKTKSYQSIPLDEIVIDKPGTQGDLSFPVENVLPVVFNAIPTSNNKFTGDETAALVQIAVGSSTFTSLVEFAGEGAGEILKLGTLKIEELSGPPVTGDFDDDACEEIGFPVTGAATMAIYKCCDLGQFTPSWVHENAEVAAEVSFGAAIDGPVFAQDIDRDGRLDLVATVAVDGARELWVSYAVGNGQWHSQPAPLPPGSTPDGGASHLAKLEHGAPLALAYLDDGDSIIDMVDGGGIWKGLSLNGGAPPLTFASAYAPHRAWTDAVIEDLNRDGRLDVVASSDGGTDIDLLTSSDSGFWNPSVLSTDGTVSHIAVGDFDGDLVNDIAFDDILSEKESLLLVAYGRTYGGPEDAVEVGNFDSIDHLVEGSSHLFGVDGIGDLGAVNRSNGARAFSFFPGTASRLLLAPLLLTEDGTANVPLAAAVGYLDTPSAQGQTAGRRDLVVLARGDEPLSDDLEDDDVLKGIKEYASLLRVWGLYGGEGDADFDRQASSQCALGGAFEFPKLDGSLSIVVAEQGDAEHGEAAPSEVFTGAPFMRFDGSTISDIQITSAITRHWFGPPGTCGVLQQHIAEPGVVYFGLRAADLNSNHIPEILALRRTYEPGALLKFLFGALNQPSANAPPPAEPPDMFALEPLATEVVVLWDSDTEALQLLPDGPLDVRDFTVGDIDGDENPELLVLAGGDQIQVYEGANGSSELTVKKPLQALEPEAQALLLADVDGDGIRDLALRGKSLKVFKGNPSTPVGPPTTAEPAEPTR